MQRKTAWSPSHAAQIAGTCALLEETRQLFHSRLDTLLELTRARLLLLEGRASDEVREARRQVEGVPGLSRTYTCRWNGAAPISDHDEGPPVAVVVGDPTHAQFRLKVQGHPEETRRLITVNVNSDWLEVNEITRRSQSDYGVLLRSLATISMRCQSDVNTMPMR